jgi:hypothetical protein
MQRRKRWGYSQCNGVILLARHYHASESKQKSGCLNYTLLWLDCDLVAFLTCSLFCECVLCFGKMLQFLLEESKMPVGIQNIKVTWLVSHSFKENENSRTESLLCLSFSLYLFRQVYYLTHIWMNEWMNEWMYAWMHRSIDRSIIDWFIKVIVTLRTRYVEPRQKLFPILFCREIDLFLQLVLSLLYSAALFSLFSGWMYSVTFVWELDWLSIQYVFITMYTYIYWMGWVNWLREIYIFSCTSSIPKYRYPKIMVPVHTVLS